MRDLPRATGARSKKRQASRSLQIGIVYPVPTEIELPVPEGGSSRLALVDQAEGG